MVDIAQLLEASRNAVAEGWYDEALALAERAFDADPNAAAANAQRGALLARLGRIDDALPFLERAVSLDSAQPVVWNNLGGVLHAAGRTDDALHAFARALALNPAYHGALNNLHVMMEAAHTHAGVRDALARLVEGGIESPELLELLARAAWTTGAHAEAVTALERVLHVDRARASAWKMLGKVQIELGNREAASAAMREVLALQPDGDAYHALASIDPAALDDDDLRQLRALAGSDLAETRIGAQFALALALNARAEHREAFSYLIAANREKRAGMTYDERATLGQMDEIVRTFDAALVADRALAHPTQRPIFIFGMPRSGTTLIEQVLASHPHVVAGGELTTLDEIVRSDVAQHGRPTRELAERYDAALAALAPNSDARVTDKMPSNVRYAGLIHMTMPNAIMIHARRDPLDTCLSCFAQEFVEPGMAWTFDLGELGRYYRAYARLAEHWNAVLPANAILDVHYEALVDDFEAQVRRILAHCGLPWDDRCLRFHETPRSVKTASALQVRRPLYRTSVRTSRAYGALLDPLREELGPYAAQ